MSRQKLNIKKRRCGVGPHINAPCQIERGSTKPMTAVTYLRASGPCTDAEAGIAAGKTTTRVPRFTRL